MEYFYLQVSEDLYVSLQDHLLQMEADEQSMQQFGEHEASNSTAEIQWNQNADEEDDNILDDEDEDEDNKEDDEEPAQKTSDED